MKKQIFVVSIFLLIICSCIPPEVETMPTVETTSTYHQSLKDNPMIHTDGVQIVDGNGKPIKLRGVMLEGWLMWNGTLWGAGLTSETTITKRLEKLVGRDETERFRQGVYNNFITEEDISQIANLGFNVVRIAFNHRLLEDDNKPFVYKDSGWKHLDKVLNWCEKNKVYAVLDLHSTPGGQSSLFVNDPDKTKLWDSEENMKRTVALWKEIASRYKDREIIAGYDLINEPGAPNGKTLVNSYARIIDTIRKVDKYHMIILEGGEFAATDFSMFEKRLDHNQLFSFHTYNLFTNELDKPYLNKLSKKAKKLDVPLWNGEFGAHTDKWLAEAIGAFEEPNSNVNGWVFWNWKRVPEVDQNRYRHLMEIKSTPKWDKVRHHVASLFGWGKKPSRKESLEGMKEFLEAIKADNLLMDKRTLDALNSYKLSGKTHNP